MDLKATVVTMPLRLPSLANCRLHWRALHRLKRAQKDAVAVALVGVTLPPLPAVVTITRVGPRRLDGDNCQGAAKYVRDSIAAAYGVDDGSPLYGWVYRQEIGREYAVRIEVAGVLR